MHRQDEYTPAADVSVRCSKYPGGTMPFHHATVIDSDQLFAAAMAALLSRDFQTVNVHSTVSAAAESTSINNTDIVLVDPFPNAAGPSRAAEILKQLRACLPLARIMVLTKDQSPAAIRVSLTAGVDAHLAKSSSPDALRQALRLVELGQSLYPAGVASLLTEPKESQLPSGSRPGDLSSREVQILSCLLSGYSNKEIARRLSITESTVKMHFKNLMRKISAENRTQAAVWALDQGIRPAADQN
jgi:two-component system, NarL family, nitrate/nitrite response regulator NarL